MRAELVQNSVALFDKIALTVVKLLLDRAPERQLRFKVDAKLISSLESSLGRTAGVETIVVYAVFLCGFHHFQPRCLVHRRCARHREDHSIVFSSQEHSFAIYKKLSAFGFVFFQTECDRLNVLAAGHFQRVQIMLKLIPRLCAVKLIFKLKLTLGGESFRFEALGLNGNVSAGGHFTLYHNAVPVKLRENTYLFRADFFLRRNEHLTEDSEPVRLRIGRSHMSSGDGIADIAYFYRDIVFAVRNKVGDIVSVRSAKAVLRSCRLSVYVNLAYSCSFKC